MDEIESAASPLDLRDAAAALDAVGLALPRLCQPDLKRARRRRRRQRIVTGAAGLALLAAGLPAAAGYPSLHTGWFDPLNHHEFLRLNSPDGVAEVKRFEPRYPLPPDGSWTTIEQYVVNKEPAELGEESDFELMTADSAHCQWMGAWLSAHAAGDAAAEARAVTVLSNAQQWIMSNGQPDVFASNGVAEQLAAQIRVGDPTLTRELYDANGCLDIGPAT